MCSKLHNVLDKQTIALSLDTAIYKAGSQERVLGMEAVIVSEGSPVLTGLQDVIKETIRYGARKVNKLILVLYYDLLFNLPTGLFLVF